MTFVFRRFIDWGTWAIDDLQDNKSLELVLLCISVPSTNIFPLNSTSSKTFELSKLKGGLVIYFYPRDNTPGCTLETKDFSKLYKKFRSLKYEVIGISKDNMKSHLGFKKKYKVPFELLSDEKVKVQKKYGVWG